MPPRHRPTAFDVSFPDEKIPVGSVSLSITTSLKRPGVSIDSEDYREVKRRQFLPVAHYRERYPDIEIESADLNIPGEDPIQFEDAEDGTQMKPVRVLTNFTFFDPLHQNEMISLCKIGEEITAERECQCVGTGFVFPHFANEEDEGQEDCVEGDEDFGTNVRLGEVLTHFFDYTQDKDPVWIETSHAWYTLKIPSTEYTPYFQHFYSSRRIAQMVISTVKRNPQTNYDEFYHCFTSTVDMFGKMYKDEHLFDAIPEIQQVLDDDEGLAPLKELPLLRQLLRLGDTTAAVDRPRRKNILPPPMKLFANKDLDLAVLRPENQTPTHVTPMIAALAQGMVFEELMVVGAPLSAKTKAVKEAEDRTVYNGLKEFVRKAKSLRGRPIVDIQAKEDFVGLSTRYLKSVRINAEMYRVGDFVVIPIGYLDGQKACRKEYPDDIDELDPTDTVADYFWFAKVLYGDADLKQFHVQWLEHSSRTVLAELGHPQELFYNDLCDHVDFRQIVAKVNVFEFLNPSTVPVGDYFVKFSFDHNLGTFTSIDSVKRNYIKHHRPPENCPICPMMEEKEEAEHDLKLKDENKRLCGVAYGGNQYHFDDYVLYKAECGPAKIGFITSLNFPVRETREVASSVDVLAVGRISMIAPDVLPDDELKDERHVYLTNQSEVVRVQDLVGVCFVVSFDSAGEYFREWTEMSPNHFYTKYRAPTLEVKSWSQMTRISYKDVTVCQLCTEKEFENRRRMSRFYRHAKRHPLRTLDLFGGVAAFSEGLAKGSKSLELTDVIEKSPSAAKTIMHNYPNVRVHNQCANVMLRYTIKTSEGHAPKAPKQIFDEACSVPGPIRDVKCLVAGFPCQSHSRLNMFRKADDTKSNLILNSLSWVDYLRPDICYFENVPGFLGFAFDAVQVSKHKVEGGTAMGGLKLIIRALGDMGYQVRFGLLQAGHYGTPQRRIRFFLIAAIDGHPLPDFPQPSHDFPVSKSLDVKLQGKREIRLIRKARGTAPHAAVTIEDAIGDLPRFDWKHPNFTAMTYMQKREIRNSERVRGVFSLPCKDSAVNVHCGFHGTPGPNKDFDYRHEPKTTYQKHARENITMDLQQFTRCFPKRKIERVFSIPLRANADYRDLRPEMQQWMTLNPLCSVARLNYRPGLYGRLDEKDCFPTTVTNMEPTAKQSRVLNPWCKRMVTVRELARSQGFADDFVFRALNNNVVTMHRQIGNAVPIQVGVALGRELGHALCKKWSRDQQDSWSRD